MLASLKPNKHLFQFHALWRGQAKYILKLFIHLISFLFILALYIWMTTSEIFLTKFVSVVQENKINTQRQSQLTFFQKCILEENFHWNRTWTIWCKTFFFLNAANIWSWCQDFGIVVKVCHVWIDFYNFLNEKIIFLAFDSQSKQLEIYFAFCQIINPLEYRKDSSKSPFKLILDS